MQNDLISRSALLRDPYFQEDRYPESHLLRMAINEAHSVDAVEVVRCKGCKYWQKRYETSGLCLNLNSVVTFTRQDFYCAKGERRADDD